MDPRFHPAIAAIKSDDLEGFRALIAEDPSLATARSTVSHPTLLQCLVLDGKDRANKLAMAEILLDAGAEIDGPFCAAASIDNVGAAELLLDRGAAVNGTGGWSPLEEALYWSSDGTTALLLERGASIHNLRIAAGLGRTDLIESFFTPDGSLKPEAGKINWPFDHLKRSWANRPQDIVNNAFVFACVHGHIDAAKLLLQKAAQINAIPEGFDYAGTGLHYAALNGHRAMTEFLLEAGADPDIRDPKVGGTAAGWAEHGGFPELSEYLKSKEKG